MIMSLPEDVTAHILSQLPVKSLVRFKSVSTQWCLMFESDYFIKLHLRNSVHNSSAELFMSLILQKREQIPLVNLVMSLNLPKYIKMRSVNLGPRRQIIELEAPFNGSYTRTSGSCNGLLCILVDDDCLCRRFTEPKFALWNPSTKKFHIPPTAAVDKVTGVDSFLSMKDAYAFGHDSINDDYKVLRMVGQHSGQHFGLRCCKFEAMVYSLKANSWRAIFVEPSDVPGLCPCLFHNDYYVLVHDAFHWLPKQRQALNMIGFDIQREEFCKLSLPSLGAHCRFGRNLGVLGQCISLASTNVIGNFDIWVMKEYGMKDSWVKLFSLEKSSSVFYDITDLKPLAYSKDNEDKILLKVNREQLIWYDLKTKTYECVEIPDARMWRSDPTYTFVESLVSPFPSMMEN